jgi:SPP1 gp7 family putative phage head morphogenesis protein
VTQGVLTGKSIPEVARDIGRIVKDPDAFRRAGKTVFKTAQRRATLIARTETLRAHNEGRKVFYRQVRITKVRWVIADDERTCPICRPLDGKVFGVDEVDGPPKHPGCRCTSTIDVG